MSEKQWQEVSDQLTRLSAKHDAIHVTMKEMEKRVDMLNHLLTGNGQPDRGLILRFDRIEVAQKRRDTWAKAAVGSAVSAVFAVILFAVRSIMKHGL